MTAVSRRLASRYLAAFRTFVTDAAGHAFYLADASAAHELVSRFRGLVGREE